MGETFKSWLPPFPSTAQTLSVKWWLQISIKYVVRGKTQKLIWQQGSEAEEQIGVRGLGRGRVSAEEGGKPHLPPCPPPATSPRAPSHTSWATILNSEGHLWGSALLPEWPDDVDLLIFLPSRSLWCMSPLLCLPVCFQESGSSCLHSLICSLPTWDLSLSLSFLLCPAAFRIPPVGSFSWLMKDSDLWHL